MTIRRNLLASLLGLPLLALPRRKSALARLQERMAGTTEEEIEAALGPDHSHVTIGTTAPFVPYAVSGALNTYSTANGAFAVIDMRLRDG